MREKGRERLRLRDVSGKYAAAEICRRGETERDDHHQDAHANDAKKNRQQSNPQTVAHVMLHLHKNDSPHLSRFR